MLTMQVIGNLGSDPEKKTTDRGVTFARFSIASNKKIKGEKITTWVNVMQYVTKGTKLFLEGEPQARAYLKDGEARSSLDMILSYGSKIEICSSDPSDNRASGAASGQSGAADEQDDYDDLNDDIPF